MFLSLTIGCAALIFYRIGQMDYGKGWPLCTLSVVVSLLTRAFVPLPLISVPLSQVLLYVAVLIYNLSRKTPPRL
jgi:hypothetical protein